MPRITWNARRLASAGLGLLGRTALIALLALDARAAEDVGALAEEFRAAAMPTTLAGAWQSLDLPGSNVSIQRSLIDSGPGWVNERFAGNAGALQLTDAADYFIVAGVEGIESVPLHEVIGEEFEAFVKDAMRINASRSSDSREQVYVLQKSTLQSLEPLWLDRENLLQDPYEPLDRTICLPIPFVGADLAMSFAPEIVIRELTDGTLEYRESLGLGTAGDLGAVLGSVQPDLQAVATSALPAISQTSAISHTSALAQPPGSSGETGAIGSAASSAGGGKACFTLRDLLLANGNDGICEFDPLDPSSWYSEPSARGTLDLRPAPVEMEVSLDTTHGLGETLLGGTYDGTMRYGLEFGFTGGDGRGIGGSIKVKVGLLFCVPLWVRPAEGRLWANFEASREIEMAGTLSVGNTTAGHVAEDGLGHGTLARDAETGAAWGGQLPDPQHIFDHTLPAPGLYYAVPWPFGPVPILLILDAPVEIGLDASLETPMATNFTTSSGVRMGFDYACSFSGGCEAKEEPYFEPWSWIELGDDAGFEDRVMLKPYAGISVRMSLYWPGVLYAKVGPRASLQLDFWGASKTCGDADGNGSQEFVTGLALDQDLVLELPAKLGLYEPLSSNAELNFLLDVVAPVSVPLVEPMIFHHAFVNLHSSAGSKAFQPMLAGPSSVAEDSPLTLKARMRPCYPYTDDVEYDLRWEAGSIVGLEGDPTSETSASHTYANPGGYTATLTAVRDSHGRVFTELDREPALAVQRAITVTPKPIVKKTAPAPIRPR